MNLVLIAILYELNPYVLKINIQWTSQMPYNIRNREACLKNIVN